MIAGGKRSNSLAYLNSVTDYDIDANTYNSIQTLPNKIRRSTLVNKDGYMYSFGGYRNGNRASVFRIPLTLTTDWEILDDMDTAGYDIIVIPYN